MKTTVSISEKLPGKAIRVAGARTQAEAVKRAPEAPCFLTYGFLMILALLFLMSPAVWAQEGEINTDLNEQIVQVPLVLDGLFGKKEVQLTATIFHPPGNGPFPLIVLSHGTRSEHAIRQKIGRYRLIPQIREFLKRDFAVIVPIRRGHGSTGGAWVESYGLSCNTPFYYEAGMEAAKDILATINYASKLPYVRPDRILLVGQSAGGFGSLAVASLNPPGVIGVVNFAGGHGGNPDTRPGIPCAPERLAETIKRFSKTIRIPVLWHYAENDNFFGPPVIKAMFAAFQEAGGQGRLVIQPPFGKDGHTLFPSRSGIPIWTVEFDKFLMEFDLKK
jgi:dienelactone hydrolase